MARTSSTLLKFARERRKNPTHTEKMLWRMLRARKRDGIKFRRESPVEGYIADFYCVEHKLIVEIDGDIHELPGKKEHDIRRQNKLEAAGRHPSPVSRDPRINAHQTRSCRYRHRLLF